MNCGEVRRHHGVHRRRISYQRNDILRPVSPESVQQTPRSKLTSGTRRTGLGTLILVLSEKSPTSTDIVPLFFESLIVKKCNRGKAILDNLELSLLRVVGHRGSPRCSRRSICLIPLDDTAQATDLALQTVQLFCRWRWFCMVVIARSRHADTEATCWHGLVAFALLLFADDTGAGSNLPCPVAWHQRERAKHCARSLEILLAVSSSSSNSFGGRFIVRIMEEGQTLFRVMTKMAIYLRVTFA